MCSSEALSLRQTKTFDANKEEPKLKISKQNYKFDQTFDTGFLYLIVLGTQWY